MTTAGALNINDPGGAALGTLNLAGGAITAQSVTRAGAVNWTDGTLTVFGGTFNNGGANLTLNGGDDDDLPTLRMASGATGTNFAATSLTLGSSRRGALAVTGGSALTVTDAHLGSLDGGDGTLTVSGAGSELAATGSFAVGGTTAAAGGTGTVNLDNSGRLRVDGTLRLWPGGTIELNGGTLRLATLDPRGGKVDLTTGKVQFTSSQTLGQTDGVADAILGPAHLLGSGQTPRSRRPVPHRWHQSDALRRPPGRQPPDRRGEWRTPFFGSKLAHRQHHAAKPGNSLRQRTDRQHARKRGHRPDSRGDWPAAGVRGRRQPREQRPDRRRRRDGRVHRPDAEQQPKPRHRLDHRPQRRAPLSRRTDQ